MRHVLRSQQFDRPLLEQLFRRADWFHNKIRTLHGRRMLQEILRSRMLFTVFYEPSTRTRMSFAAAAQHLGMEVVTTENASEFSSAVKGESLEDTIRVLCEYHPDVIVIRHHETGAAERAARVSSRPIVNAGDGQGQHPTQALLDLYTIRQEIGRLDGLTVTIGGDLARGRTARSLAYLLTKFDKARLIFIAPPGLEMGDDIKEHLAEKGTPFIEESSLAVALPKSDVVYWTRIQKERAAPGVDHEAVARQFSIGSRELELMKPEAVLMHPLPRNAEIAAAVDSDPRAAYFRQAGNGMLIRMALLEWVIGVS